MWLGWILASCGVLSLYDLCKKASVRENAVFPCLLGSALSGWTAVTVWLMMRGQLAATVCVSGATACLLLVKSVIVGASWTATYMALKSLPITCAAPIRATGPFWTLAGAVFLFAEWPTPAQAVGMALTLAGCFLFSLSARYEGIDILHSRAVALALLGTVLGSASALYDKHLLRARQLPTATVLWWFLGGMAVIYMSVVLAARFRAGHGKFEFRWTIPCVGLLLAASDACYFNAVGAEGAQISVLSMIRRSSVVLTFILGGAVFRETNLRRKALALATILAGVFLLCLAARR